MRNATKLGAASLTLAVFISGCAPMTGTTPQTGTTYNPGTTYNSGANYNANTGAGGYDYSTGGNTSYDYGNGSGSSYGNGNANSNTYDNYYAGNNSSSYGSSGNYNYNYNGGDSGSSCSGTVNGSVSGSYAVQVVASPNRGTAENMVGQMQSYGFTATLDQVGGYCKVRVPYNSESEAKSNLGRIRSYVPDAFYTTR